MKMNEYEKTATVSKIIGALVESEASALEAIELLEEAKQIYLERSWHISIDKKSRLK